MKTMEDMNPMLLAQISHFFEHYKDLEAHKWVKVSGWIDGDAVEKEILDSIERYNQPG
jgi:inorganic pyrophosphatase